MDSFFFGTQIILLIVHEPPGTRGAVGQTAELNRNQSCYPNLIAWLNWPVKRDCPHSKNTWIWVGNGSNSCNYSRGYFSCQVYFPTYLENNGNERRDPNCLLVLQPVSLHGPMWLKTIKKLSQMSDFRAGIKGCGQAGWLSSVQRGKFASLLSALGDTARIKHRYLSHSFLFIEK